MNTARRSSEVSPGCPCGCLVTGSKLTKYAHVIGCACRPCTGRRNRAKGQASQRKMHRASGGTGWTPQHEGRTVYTYEASPENKTGQQIPDSWRKFLSSVFFVNAMRQNAKDTPVGSMAKPALCLDGRYVVIDLGPGASTR